MKRFDYSNFLLISQKYKKYKNTKSFDLFNTCLCQNQFCKWPKFERILLALRDLLTILFDLFW